ncbi:hypothetical protein SDC9_212825 [bioreactor metagenome]|uniref:Uncharacterized protein n=1 Tax=bioreactor metagenome TaxID=1076179 RepID=A0A645JNU7_9ZZZZ
MSGFDHFYRVLRKFHGKQLFHLTVAIEFNNKDLLVGSQKFFNFFSKRETANPQIIGLVAIFKQYIARFFDGRMSGTRGDDADLRSSHGLYFCFGNVLQRSLELFVDPFKNPFPNIRRF